MSADDALLEIFKDAVGNATDLTGRRMFGGLGVYGDGVFFAILSDGAAYFRASEKTVAEFEAEGSHPFTYQTKTGENALKSYWSLPTRLLDESADLRHWILASISAAKEHKSQMRPRHTPRRAKLK